jgi:membrane-associated phospholipid phosphatase
MEGMLTWGLEVVRGAQTVASPAFTVVMKAVSAIGTEWFYLAALPLIYWCIDRRRGLELSVLFFFSSFVNLWLKDVFAQPRPFQLEPKLGLASETSYGLPSGHAQGSLLFWGGIAPLFRRPWGLVLAVVLPLAVGFSRVYLGVHFPTDVFGGWLLAGIFLVLYVVLSPRLRVLLSDLSPRFQALGAAAIALAMNAIDKNDTSISGIFFGASMGFIFMKQVADFDEHSCGFARKLLRYIVGLAGTVLLYLGLKAILPGPGTELYALLRFARYALVGAWVALGAPWVFLRLGLAAPRPKETAEEPAAA